MSDKHDPVNNPSHYTQGAIECIEAIEAALSQEEFIGFLRGQVIKYQWRCRHKSGSEDVRKGIWYANRLVMVLENMEMLEHKLEILKERPPSGPIVFEAEAKGFYMPPMANPMDDGSPV